MAKILNTLAHIERLDSPSWAFRASERFGLAAEKYRAQEEREDQYTHAKVHPEFFERLIECVPVSQSTKFEGALSCYGFILQRDKSLKPNEVFFHGPHRPLGYRVLMTNP